MSQDLRKEAEDDLADAYDWYEGRCDGLGLRFLDAVEICLSRIQLQPYAHQVVYETSEPVRRSLVPRFPYGVYYTVLDTQILVLAVRDCREDPEKLHRLLLQRSE